MFEEAGEPILNVVTKSLDLMAMTSPNVIGVDSLSAV